MTQLITFPIKLNHLIEALLLQKIILLIRIVVKYHTGVILLKEKELWKKEDLCIRLLKEINLFMQQKKIIKKIKDIKASIVRIQEWMVVDQEQEEVN